jgi:AraC-like DNA-binding protein
VERPSAIGALRWIEQPRWYLWDGGFLALGKIEGVVPPHSHHALQIVIGIDGDVAAKAGGDWRSGAGLIVRSDVEHAFDGKGASGAMLFVDPESSEGTWLDSALVEDVTVVPQTQAAPCIAALRAFVARPLEAASVGALVRGCVAPLCRGAPPARRLDARVSRVLEALRTADSLRLSLDEAAGLAFLSASRFAHLFKEQVGLPFKRYLLWRKLARAMLTIGRDRSLSAAAHAADFADAAHLTRTFQQMFGLAPSLMMRGKLCEIPSPFSPLSAAKRVPR